MAEQTGLARVLAEAGAGDEQTLETDAEQLDLLGLSMRDGKRPVGRPPGRRNVRTQRIAEFILSTVGDPAVELARMGMLGVDNLAAALGCSRAEAIVEKRLCLIAVLPYVHSRMPIAVDVRDHKVVSLTIVEGPTSGSDAANDAGITVLDGVAEIVANQGVDDGAA